MQSDLEVGVTVDVDVAVDVLRTEGEVWIDSMMDVNVYWMF